MRQRGAKLGLQAILLLIVISVPSSPRAQRIEHGTAHLTVCNRGKIAIDVFVAKKTEWLTRDQTHILGQLHNGWDIESTRLPIGFCEQVYAGEGISYADGPPAHIGFGFVDSHGQFGAGTIAQVPDLGSSFVARGKGFSGHDVLAKGDKKFCVRRDKTAYRTEGELATNCATLQTGGNNDLRQFVSMTSALYFRPRTSGCKTDGCSGGEYFLTVAAVTNDRAMAAMAGSSDDKSKIAPGDAQDASKVLAEYARKERQQRLDASDRANAAQDAASKQQLADAAAKGDEYARQRLAATLRYEEEQRQKWSLPRESPASYAPQWLGKTKVIKGTVSRVEMRTSALPHWVTIFFKESPDATFVVCSPYANIFRERVGDDLSLLIGRTLEVAGNVEPPLCAGKAGSVRVLESYPNGFRMP